MKTTHIKRFIPITLVLSLLVSCTKTPDDTVALMLIDGSASTAPAPGPNAGEIDDRRPDFLQGTREIVSGAGPGVTIQCGLIDDNPLRVSRLPVSVTFPTFNPAWDNPNRFKLILLRKKEEVMAAIEKTVMEKARTSSTCIIDSMLLAQQVFDNGRHKNKVMILFSDMLEDCGTIDFDSSPRPGTRGVPRDESEVKRLIAELKRQQKLPNLAGVKVYVAVSTGEKRDHTSARYLLIMNWWKAFFQEAGAATEGYGMFTPPALNNSFANVPLPAATP
jgi:hypothetical protein